MRRKRPCRICRQWFLPHPRAGNRQRVCSQAGCQRDRNRQACAAWRAKNPDYDREDRLRRRLVSEAGETGLVADPLVRIDREAARNAVGLEAYVFVDETAKVLVAWAQHAVIAEQLGIKKESARDGPG